MSGAAPPRDSPGVFERRKPGPKKRFFHQAHIYLTDEEKDMIEREAALQSVDTQEKVSQADVVRQCIRLSFGLDEDDNET